MTHKTTQRDNATESRKRGLDTRKSLAEYLGVSARTISRLVESGQMPAPVRIGRSVRFDPRVVDEWLEKGCPGGNRKEDQE